MKSFRYEVAPDARTAVRTVGSHRGAMFLGGGTNLVDLMRLGVAQPELLVDVSHLPQRSVDVTPSGGLLIGAAVRNSDLAANSLVRERYPMLCAALLSGASGQVRNMATVAGNLLQRTRCLYFQDVDKPCNKRTPGSGCSAREGEHRALAIIGASESCVATHPSDLAVALVALDAVAHIETTDRTETIPLRALYRLPGTDPQRDTNLQPGALITAVEVPYLDFARRSAYRKIGDRSSFSFAVVSVAAAIAVKNGMVRDARLAFGGVAHAPWRARAAEGVLRAAQATPDRFREAVDVELSRARPLRDNAFKVDLVRRLAVRTLADLIAQSG